jgi:hypothetical protein
MQVNQVLARGPRYKKRHMRYFTARCTILDMKTQQE